MASLLAWATGGFRMEYVVHSVALKGRGDLEYGGKTRMEIQWPVLFKVENKMSPNFHFTHCGVLEFVAEEGFCYMPYWMMCNLQLEEGQHVVVSQRQLPHGSFVKLQPHEKKFLQITNPRAVLETLMREFSCMTVGDVFKIKYIDDEYSFTILELKPADAVSIIETDVQTDFAPPLDYNEDEDMASSPSTQADASSGTAVIGPAGASPGERLRHKYTLPTASTEAQHSFPGAGHRLVSGRRKRKGGVSSQSSSPVRANSVPNAQDGDDDSSSDDAETGLVLGTSTTGLTDVLRKAPSDVVDSGASPSAHPPRSAPVAMGDRPSPAKRADTSSNKGDRKFMAFSGAGHSLRKQ